MNVRAAGLTNDITIEQQDFKDFIQPKEKSIIVTNPPYGERISTPNLLDTYRMIGERLKHQFTGGEAWVLSYREECFEQIGLKPSIKIPLFNGSLECELRKYQMFDGKLREFRSEGCEVKTEEEKRQMAEHHRFKKMREFKQRRDEQEDNEDGDIRSFTFHRHDIGGEKREARSERKEFKSDRREGRDRSDRRGGDRDRKGNRFDQNIDRFDKRGGGKPKYQSTENRGGHERFDRSGGGKKKK